VKLNLLWGTNKTLSGFINIDPFCSVEGTPEKVNSSVSNLDGVCEDAEADLIIATEIINMLPSWKVDDTIEHWIKKMRHGGHIILEDFDIYLITKAIQNRNISLVDANTLLYGDQNEPHKYRQSCLSGESLVKMLKSHDLKIIKNRILDNYKFLIEAERP
jgi:hypothetical protein